MDKTNNLGLNLPDKGYRDWDIPINENFEILDAASSDVQEQLKGKQATITGAASTVTTSNLTASRALVSNGSGKVAVSAVTSTELGYLDGVTSSIQTQLNAKQTTANLSQTLDTSTTKYPSNAAVKKAIDAKDSLPSQSGNSGKFLTTNGTTASWGTIVSPTITYWS